MYFSTLALLCLSAFCVQALEEDPPLWELHEYRAEKLPKNAFISGVENHDNIYIGVKKSDLIAGKVVESRTRLEYVKNGRVVKEVNKIWVLTTEYPEKFSWLTISNADQLKKKVALNLVSFQPDHYVIRVGKPGSHSIGSLQFVNGELPSVQAVNLLGRVQTYDVMEVLVYSSL